MIQYFPNPFRSFERNINVQVDLSNYATKADIKNISYVDTSSFALKTNLANLKTEVDKLDINKLVPVPTDLSKLSNVVKNDVVKKTVYDKLVAKVNANDTSDFVSKTKYDTDKSELDNKIPDTSDLVKKTDCNTKITEMEGKIPDVSNLATKTALSTVENKIPDVTNLVTKTALTNIENKIPGVTNLATKTALTTLENKIPDVSSLIKKTDYNTRVAEIDTKVSNLKDKIAKNESTRKKIVDAMGEFLLCFLGNIMFGNGDSFQAYLIFNQHIYIY